MKRTARLLLLACALGACGDPGAIQPEEASGPGVVLIIGDGMGFASVQAARLSSRRARLSMELPISGRVRTASASDSVTDSAAGATALATGVSTDNGKVGVAPDLRVLKTVLEVAEERGMATGLVATSSVVHATPAAFAAHVADRNDYPAIALQMARSGVDVLLGGGQDWFRGDRRKDGRDLVGELRARGCRYYELPDSLPRAGGGSRPSTAWWGSLPATRCPAPIPGVRRWPPWPRGPSSSWRRTPRGSSS